MLKKVNNLATLVKAGKKHQERERKNDVTRNSLSFGSSYFVWEAEGYKRRKFRLLQD